MAMFLRGSFQVSERRACRVLNLQRSVYYYRRYTVEGKLHEKLKCPKCNRPYMLRDDHAQLVFLTQAKPGMKALIEREKFLAP